ncbi:MAG: hypothetical protein ABSD11_19810 [Methylocella sp.]|jgi:hypothetical protein
MATSAVAKSAKITLAPHNQSLEAINAIVAGIIGKSGCRTCGRLIQLEFQFQGDPDPDLVKAGVISVQTEGF